MFAGAHGRFQQSAVEIVGPIPIQRKSVVAGATGGQLLAAQDFCLGEANPTQLGKMAGIFIRGSRFRFSGPCICVQDIRRCHQCHCYEVRKIVDLLR